MRRHRALVIGAVCTAVVLAAGVCGGMYLLGGSEDDAQSPAVRHETVEVSRRTLTRSIEQSGTLGYGEPWGAGTQAAGTITWLPEPGTVLDRGSILAKVDEKAVVTMTGALPLYRPLGVGAKGADVRQLEENLQAMGYGGFTVDEKFDAATARAVRELQRNLGRERTGEVTSEWVTVLPTAARVAAQDARVGDGAGPRLVTVTAPDHLATVDVRIGDRDLAEVGRQVQVTLPGGTVAQGTITKVDPPVAKEPEDGSTPDPADATIHVTVRIDDPDALGGLDVTPVKVTFPGEQHADVLAVPVKALLALAEGGYALEVADTAGVGGAGGAQGTGGADGAAPATRLVAVETGMFADGYVEVTPKDAGGLSEGQRVVVPS